MQAQSRLAVSSASSEDEHEAVIRELTRGHELTARLRAEALHALRGQGQAEATAAFILQEVSRAFSVCLSIMSSPARAPPPEMPAPAVAPTRRRDDITPREQRMTSSPHHDGYQWRKYGQKRITRAHFHRCYYRCSFHRERGCRATKQVQQCSNGDPAQYLVMYFNDHTCDDTAAWGAPPPAEAAAAMLDLPSGSGSGLPAARHQMDGRGVQEEHERQVLVSSLARVLGGQQHMFQLLQPPAAGSAAVAVSNVPPRDRGITRDAPAPAPASAVVDAPGEMPPRLDVDVLGLDVMDYDVDITGALSFCDSYGLLDGTPPF